MSGSGSTQPPSSIALALAAAMRKVVSGLEDGEIMDPIPETGNSPQEDAPMMGGAERLKRDSLVEDDASAFLPKNKGPSFNELQKAIPRKRRFNEHDAELPAPQRILSTTPLIMASSEPHEPGWYTNARWVSLSIHTQQRSRSMLESVSAIRTHLRKAEAAMTNGERQYHLNQLRVKLHAAFFTHVTAEILKKARALDTDVGLASIFHHPRIPIPFDIKSDAQELYDRWHAGRFETNLLFGIVAPKNPITSGVSGSKVSPKFKDGFSNNFRVFGHNGLINGQWWPIQLCLVRDGAHGTPQGGISGSTGEGATSIIVAGQYRDDEDQGDRLWYCGTKQNNSEKKAPTAGIQLLKTAFQQDRVIRVIRSSSENSTFAPRRGYRYDGLYRIQEERLVDEAKHHWKFLLVREPGQDPIRFEGPGVRPTMAECNEFESNKRLMGFAAPEERIRGG